MMLPAFERALLSVGLSVGGLMLTLAATVFLLTLNVSPEVLTWVSTGMLPAGVFLAARAAPRVLPVARQYAAWRRTLAGTIGVVMGVALTLAAEALGLDLSHNPSRSAAMRDGIALILFFGGMVCGTFLTLGRPAAGWAPVRAQATGRRTSG